MKRAFANVLGALALGWMGGAASAQAPASLGEPVPSRLSVGQPATTGQPISMLLDQGEKVAPPKAAPAKVDSVSSASALFCDSDSCDNGGGGGRFVGGMGFLWIQPKFESNPALFSSVSTTSTTGAVRTAATITREVDFGHHLEGCPQLWLGYVSECGLGARIRWFNVDTDTGAGLVVPNAGPNSTVNVTTATPLGLFSGRMNAGNVPGETFAARSDLRLSVWDLEATKELKACGCDLTLAGGVRYAFMKQAYNVVDLGPTGTVRSSIYSDHNFNGAGPTLALDARAPIGCGGLALYGNARGSILFGDSKHRALSNSNVGTEVQVRGLDDSERDTGCVLGVAELEVGVQYTRCMGRAQLTGQFGLLGQLWIGGGNATDNTGANVFGFVGPSTTDSNFGLIGMAFRVGVNF